MKVSQVLTPQEPSIKQEYKSQILKGKCYNISRTFSVMIETKNGNEFKIISIGIFERVRNTLLKLVGVDYLNHSLHGKVSILNPDDLQSKMVSDLSQQTISPQKTTPISDQITQPQTSATIASPTSMSNASKSTKRTAAASTPARTAPFDEAKLIQIFTHHAFVNIKETLSNFKKNNSVNNLLNHIKDSNTQKIIYSNTEPKKFMVDVQNFALKNNLDKTELRILLIYMVLVGEISGFHQTERGTSLFCLYKNSEDHPQVTPYPLFNREKILEIDSSMADVEATLPKLPKELDGKPITEEQKTIFETIKSNLIAEHYHRFVFKDKQAIFLKEINNKEALTLNEVTGNSKPVFDYFVNQGAIHSWNRSQNKSSTCYVKIKQDDDFEPSSFMWALWRDKAAIQQEE